MTPVLPRSVAPPDASIVDCWSRIGVYGDGSCVELPRHVHCRNCPVYSAAAIRLLDRNETVDGPDDALANATRLFALERADARRNNQSAFLFRIGSEWLALPTDVLDEVAELRVIHSLPHRRSGVVLGLANVRGELLVCVSLAQLLGIDALVESSGARGQRAVQRRLLVARRVGSRVAFPADDVHGIERFDDSEIGPVPATVAKASASYSKAMLSWREHAVGLLDEELLFHSLYRSLA